MYRCLQGGRIIRRGPNKEGALPVLIRRLKAVRGTDALLAQSHVRLMEFLQLVTQAQGGKGKKGKKEKRRK
jgi:hypothetical protein